MIMLGDITVAEAVNETAAEASAQNVVNDYASAGIPSQRSARSQDYRDAEGLTPNRPTAGAMPSGPKSSVSSSNLLIYGGGALAILALVLLVRRK